MTSDDQARAIEIAAARKALVCVHGVSMAEPCDRCAGLPAQREAAEVAAELTRTADALDARRIAGAAQICRDAAATLTAQAAEIGRLKSTDDGWRPLAKEIEALRSCYAQEVGWRLEEVRSREAAEAKCDRMREALEAVWPMMIPGMNWTDETGQLVKSMVRAALNPKEPGK